MPEFLVTSNGGCRRVEKSRKCFPLSVIATFFVPASVVLFDHLSVSLALNYLFIFFELLHLTLVCSLFHALSFFCLHPFDFTQFKQMKRKQLVRTVSEIVAFIEIFYYLKVI